MNTNIQMQSALLSDLNVSSSSSLYPTTTIQLALNRAYQKASTLFRWSMLSDAKVTSTIANQEYYDEPSTWRPNSTWRLEVGGTLYGEGDDGNPLNFNDYLIWKSENANSTEKKWSVFNGFYFIYPTPTVNGSSDITIWGQKNITELANDGDVTIFSYSMPECNDAIVLEAGAILKKKGELEKVGQMLSEEAKQILILAFQKQGREKAKYEKIQPGWDIPDYYGRSQVENDIGRF